MTNKKSNKIIRTLQVLFLLLLILAILMGLASCKKDQETDEGGEGAVERNEAIMALLVDNLGAYQIVRSETMADRELKTVLAFASVIQERGYPDMSIVSDFEAVYPVISQEIIIGDTTRKGSVYNEGEGIVAETEGYTVSIIEKRLIVSYTDEEGLIDCLEYILFSSLDAEQAALTNSYNEALFLRGIKRNITDEFSVKNSLAEGSVLSTNSDIPFIGTAAPGATVTVQLMKGNELLGSADAVADDNGVWQTKVAPNTSANSVWIRVDGNLAEKFTNINFKENPITSCSEGTQVFINGKQIDVHTNQGGNYAIASLAKGEQKMEIKLVRSSDVKDFTVRPLSAGVEAKANGKEITFTVTQFPCKLSVEFESFANVDNITQSVQLFLYPHEEFVPDLNGRDLIYFAPGEYWFNDKLDLPSNTTVYISEGAVLHAKFDVRGAENLTVMGRGIIDTYYFTDNVPKEEHTHMTVFRNCKNLVLKDYTITGSRKWMTVLRDSEVCTVNYLNILGTEMNSDGVDIVSSKNVTVSNCFIRSNDDCIAIKADGLDVDNILVKGCVIWNMKYGNGLEIGYETRCENITNITFEDNDLIYVGGSAISIHLGDRAHVQNVKYKDLRIENSSDKLVDFFIKETNYTKDPERGNITSISIENISVLSDNIGRIIISGYDSTHYVNGVYIQKIMFNGKYMDSISSILSKGSYVYYLKYDGKSL